MIERIAEPAAQRRHVIDFLRDVGIGRGAGPGDVIRSEPIQERRVGLDAEEKARGQHVVVSTLHPAGEASERASEIGRIVIAQSHPRVSAAVADVASDIEASPIVIRRGRRLDRQGNDAVSGYRPDTAQRGHSEAAGNEPFQHGMLSPNSWFPNIYPLPETRKVTIWYGHAIAFACGSIVTGRC